MARLIDTFKALGKEAITGAAFAGGMAVMDEITAPAGAGSSPAAGLEDGPQAGAGPKDVRTKAEEYRDRAGYNQGTGETAALSAASGDATRRQLKKDLKVLRRVSGWPLERCAEFAGAMERVIGSTDDDLQEAVDDLTAV